MLCCQQCCEFYHAHCVRASRWRGTGTGDWTQVGRNWSCPRCMGVAPAAAGAAAAAAASSVGGVSVGRRRTGDEPPLVAGPHLGLTLVHFSAQPEPFLKQKHTQNPPTAP